MTIRTFEDEINALDDRIQELRENQELPITRTDYELIDICSELLYMLRQVVENDY